MGQDKTSKTHPPPNHLFEVGKIYIRQSRRDREFRHPFIRERETYYICPMYKTII